MKRFYHYEHRTTSLRELFTRVLLRHPISVRRAEFSLVDFSLQVERGEAVALIGANGSGKSTALRLMAGVYAPTEGRVRTEGRLGAVIELGVGFHPELTGAENVALYSAVMGLSRREARARFPEIAAFAGIGDFMNEPVKYYSSGMQARLAFSVAVCIRPDILLLDEVLAVGDQSFRERCFAFLEGFHDAGGTLVIVSHDLESIRRLCSRAVWLEHGRTRMSGDVELVLSAYQDALETDA